MTRPQMALLAATLLLAAVACTSLPDSAIEQAIEFRESTGLRSDREHVVAVANDPRATLDYGVPLLPEEVAELERQGLAADRGIGPVQWYAARHPDTFGGLSVDGAAIIVRFTADIEAHAAALRRLSPGREVRVELVRFSERELSDLQARISADFDALRALGIHVQGVGLDVLENRVAVTAQVDDIDQARQAFADRYGAARLGLDLVPRPGPWTQAQTGPGWRLLAAGAWGQPYVVRAARTAAELAEAWASLGAPGEPPAIDAATELVVLLTPAVGSSCPEIRLDGVVIDLAGGVVHGTFSDPLGPRPCTADATPYTFAVALDRAALPDGAFDLQLYPEEVCVSCDEDRIRVEPGP